VPTVTATTVIDASAVCAVLFDEPQSDRISDRLEGTALASTELLLFEVANSCIVNIRRHPEKRTEFLQAFGRLAALDVAFMKVDHADVVLLAEETGLTAYDASYLWLAHTLNADLVTLDDQLAAAHALLRS
jgi:predicted nucleic acid-binding protein